SRIVVTMMVACRQGNKKRRTGSLLAFDPDFSTLPLQHALRDGETETFADRGIRIEPVENFKRLGLMLRRDANAIVGDGIECLAILDPTGDLHAQWPRGLAIFQRVVDQVGENLAGLRAVAEAARQRFNVNLRAGFI